MSEEDARLAFVYVEAQRSITQQQDVLNQLRSNAGTLLGAVSVATGFLAGLHGRRPLGTWGNVAVYAFIAAVVLAVLILWPRNRWRFRLRTDTLLDGYVDAGASMDVMHRQLATYLERDYDGNRKKLRWMFYLFDLATAAMVVEVVAWVMELTRSK
jgi:hypothetical protein